MDMSVGKAGDIQKWLDSKLSFVFGIDFAKDNIENRMDGACARYIKMKRKRIKRKKKTMRRKRIMKKLMI